MVIPAESATVLWTVTISVTKWPVPIAQKDKCIVVLGLLASTLNGAATAYRIARMDPMNVAV